MRPIFGTMSPFGQQISCCSARWLGLKSTVCFWMFLVIRCSRLTAVVIQDLKKHVLDCGLGFFIASCHSNICFVNICSFLQPWTWGSVWRCFNICHWSCEGMWWPCHDSWPMQLGRRWGAEAGARIVDIAEPRTFEWLMCAVCTNSTAQGGGGSFKNRKPIGEIGCCESRMAERIHWWTERCLRSPLSLSLFLWLSTYLPFSLSINYLSIYLPTYIYLSIYLSLSLSLSLSSVYLSSCLPVYLSIYLSICLSVYLSICGAVSFSVM